MNKNYTLITGASSGIGKALAEEIAKDGKNVVLVSQNKQALESVAKMLVKKYKISAKVITQDLSEPESGLAVYREVHRQGLVIDTLVNNAGIGDYGKFVKSDKKRIHDIMMVNIVALTELTRLFLPDLLKLKSARIMNTASVAGFLPGPFMSVYFASKHYVLAFSEGLREELRDSPVTVTALCPPPVNTPFVQTAHINSKNYMAKTHVKPESVAKYGYRAMKQGRAIYVPTLPYKLLTSIGVRILPRWKLRKMLYNLNGQGRRN